jgi:hypothetical protein
MTLRVIRKKVRSTRLRVAKRLLAKRKEIFCWTPPTGNGGSESTRARSKRGSRLSIRKSAMRPSKVFWDQKKNFEVFFICKTIWNYKSQIFNPGIGGTRFLAGI